MHVAFEDIVIVDLDLGKTGESRVHPSMRTLYLKLNRAPDSAWVRYFREERESRIVLKRHGLWIEDDYLIFDCRLGDVERHHLPDIRQSIAYANRKCREQAERQAEVRAVALASSEAERRELTRLRERVRRAAGAERAGPAVPPTLPHAEFDARRNDWRARFRAALAAVQTEPDRVDD
jgi:hypothetical protein